MSQRAEALLKRWLSDTARIEHMKRGRDGDLVVHDGRATLVVELKRLGDPGWLSGAIAQVQAAARSFARNAVPVVGVPFMGQAGRSLCQAAGVSWFDLSGNAEIVAPGLRIYVEGKENIFKRVGRPSTVFAPKSARIVRLLLLNPSKAFRQRDLALNSGLDEGFTSRIVRKLEADRLVRRGDDGVRLVDPNLLLDSWRETYDFTKHQVTSGHVTARSGEEALARIARALRDHKLDYAATGLGAAWMLTDFAQFRLATFFVPEEPTPSIFKTIGFRREQRGANVWFVVPNDEGVFAGSRERKGIRTVHPVQAYVDLKGHPERAPEAAEELRRQHMQWRV